MNEQEAIMAFSQSEKAKSGIIWASQALELLSGLPVPEKPGAEKAIRMKIDMMIQEIRLAKRITGDPAWDDIEPILDQAMVMIHSGVAPDSVVHLTQALSRVTSIGHRSMSFLKDKGLI
jgi:hypothetical protein